MKHALIVAHPKARSFTQAMAKACAEALEGLGHEVAVRDLYRLGFDPCLAAEELPSPEGFAPREDVVAERALLADVQAFAFFYPVWFNAPPAILKGYVDRVFGMGFGYGVQGGASAPLLAGKSLISFSSSGAPHSWMVETGAWDAMRKLFDEHLGAVTGLSVLDHLHFGSITPGIRSDVVRSSAAQVREAARRRFGQGT